MSKIYWMVHKSSDDITAPLNEEMKSIITNNITEMSATNFTGTTYKSHILTVSKDLSIIFYSAHQGILVGFGQHTSRQLSKKMAIKNLLNQIGPLSCQLIKPYASISPRESNTFTIVDAGEPMDNSQIDPIAELFRFALDQNWHKPNYNFFFLGKWKLVICRLRFHFIHGSARTIKEAHNLAAREMLSFVKNLMSTTKPPRMIISQN